MVGTFLIKLEGNDRKFLEAWGVRYRINWRPTFLPALERALAGWSTERARGAGRAANTLFAWSSNCGAPLKWDTAAWPRTCRERDHLRRPSTNSTD